MSRIIVKNLPQQGLNQDDLKKHFSDIDNVTDVTLKYNDFGAFRRFAFVGFKTQDAAQRAIEKLNNTFIKNSKISLEQCKAIKESKQDKRDPKRPKPGSEGYEGELDKPNKNIEKASGKIDILEEYNQLKDDPEFKEFLELQRNIGENSKSKQIWSDDVNMDAENLGLTAGDVNAVKPGDSMDQDPEFDNDKPRKKHKRSRGKKNKQTKTKPQELFVHTAKVKGFPKEAKRKDVKEFFKPLQLLSVRLSKRDEVCYVSFKDESDLKFALRKDMQFHGTNRMRLWRHDIKRSRVYKDQVREKVQERAETFRKHEIELANAEPVEESGRLFVRNLNYTCTQDDLEEVFSEYGQLTEIHMPIDKQTSMPKGYAYVEFMFPENAAKAYKELNGTIFQGRNFHLIPSKPKPEPRLGPDGKPIIYNSHAPAAQSSFKREKLHEQKQTAPRGSNWNILFLGQNALADVVSDNKGIEKSQLLTQTSRKDTIAVRMALGDAMVVEEMRKFLVSNGVELDSFDNPQAPRSRSVIIVKNLPASVTKNELSELFEAQGRVGRVIIPPNGLTAIVEMEEPTEAKLAFKRLAYSKFKDTILYLEWAPINVFREKSLEEQELGELEQMERVQTGTKILVKNIPFEATQAEVKKIFAAYGEINFVRVPKKIDGQHRGFGFVDYLTKEDALRAFRSLCHSTHLYGRKLVLEWAKVEDSKVGDNAENG